MEMMINLAYKKAWSFHYTTGVEWEELFGEALVALAAAMPTHDPSKSKLTTWATRHIDLALIAFCQKQRCQHTRHTSASVESASTSANLFHNTSFKERMAQLSHEAKDVASLVLSSPTEFISLPPKLARGKIQRYLHSIGWPHSQIWEVFHELKTALREI